MVNGVDSNRTRKHLQVHGHMSVGTGDMRPPAAPSISAKIPGPTLHSWSHTQDPQSR